jgi:hypothetical protein
MEELFSTPYITIRLHRGSHKTIEIQWLDFVPSTEFRASMRELLYLAKRHQVKAWVVDNRLTWAMRTADLAWGGQEVIPPMGELGVQRLAGVESQDGLNRMGVTALLADVLPGTNITSRFFSTLEEARAWARGPL